MVTVDYWSISLKDLSETVTLYPLLSAEEKRRSLRFKFPELQQRFILGRGKLRQILGCYLNQNPQDLEFIYGEYGKPFVQNISFNFSHTKELAFCAVTKEISSLNLGIDIEIINRKTDPLALAKRFFDPVEFQYLQSQSLENQLTDFVRFWTAKEAYLKALGTGLQGGLDQVVIALTDQPSFQNSGAQDWTLKMFQPDAHHWGAIAVNTNSCEFRDCGEWIG
ncbi:MAG: 4'-phosphopantetheinyl transferase superfamily protein [Limnothrix sp. RL_2_0]|nr:4'-phosphopantetheinyl transferase superfamily protein [Limnothrix sp. RL_2_0]